VRCRVWLQAAGELREHGAAAARSIVQQSSELGDSRPISYCHFSADGAMLAACGERARPWPGLAAEDTHTAATFYLSQRLQGNLSHGWLECKPPGMEQITSVRLLLLRRPARASRPAAPRLARTPTPQPPPNHSNLPPPPTTNPLPGWSGVLSVWSAPACAKLWSAPIPKDAPRLTGVAWHPAATADTVAPAAGAAAAVGGEAGAPLVLWAGAVGVESPRAPLSHVSRRWRGHGGAEGCGAKLPGWALNGWQLCQASPPPGSLKKLPSDAKLASQRALRSHGGVADLVGGAAGLRRLGRRGADVLRQRCGVATAATPALHASSA
jgi:hypothetical protein